LISRAKSPDFGHKRQNEKIFLKKNAFPKRFRLLNNDEFKAVIRRRRRLANNVLTLYFFPNGFEFSRLGVTLGKSAGNAVERNRFKRLVREVFRQCRDQLPAGFDFVILKQKSKKKLAFQDVKKAFLNLAQKIE
jgi:ribonuclease P protein component